MLGPPSEVAKQKTLGYTPGQGSRWFDVGEGECTPKAYGGEAVSHTAAEGDGMAVRVLVVDKVESKDSGAMTVLFCSFGIGIVCEFCVEQLEVLDGEGAAVVIHLGIPCRAIV